MITLIAVKILFVSSECVPFAKAGGLGDVVGALPKALKALGHDVRVLLPRYGILKATKPQRIPGPLGVRFGWGTAWCGVLEDRLPDSDVPIYFLEHNELFDDGALYADEDGSLQSAARFALLSQASFELCRFLDFEPDILHVNDWPSAWAAVSLNHGPEAANFPNTASVMTIHNMNHQPRFPVATLELLHLPAEEVLRPDCLGDYGGLNPFKGGLYNATKITTVSPTYAREIRSPEFGAGLDDVMRFRAADLVGVLNGIDEETWNPATDPHIPENYSVEDMSGKAACKAALQREFGLDVRPDVPLLGIVSRLSPQKGIDVVMRTLDGLLGLDVQLAILGSGDPTLEAWMRGRGDRRDGRFAAWVGYNEALAHRIEAGSDFFLMPSRFEPCGLNQLYSQRYGTLPIVRATGGLEDTVEQCDPVTGRGTGFKLWDLHEGSLYETVRWAVNVWRDRPDAIQAMQRRCMKKKMGWGVIAREYEEIYRWALESKGIKAAKAAEASIEPEPASE